MADDQKPKLKPAATMQIDAVEDALEVLEDLEMARGGFDDAQIVEGQEDGGPSLPPPLPPSPSGAPSSPPAPRSPIIYVLGGAVALAAGAAGIWLASTMLEDDPVPEPDGTMEIGPIEMTIPE